MLDVSPAKKPSCWCICWSTLGKLAPYGIFVDMDGSDVRDLKARQRALIWLDRQLERLKSRCITALAL